MPSLSNARANSLDFTHVWISEPVVMEIFTKGPRTHTYVRWRMTRRPVYPVMTFFKIEFLASKTYLGGKKNVPYFTKFKFNLRVYVLTDRAEVLFHQSF